MSLSPGTRLGPYEIQSAIGAGGMGEVYKARDTRLDRTVAIKVLPPEVSADPERRARFEREAKTIAGLNHPHICTLHDVGEHDGSTFLVMEHLDGLTLAERLLKGPLPLVQVFTIATEIAEALSTAHRHGVVHRDLKPANVLLTKSGAKLLDFGLARLTGHGEEPAAACGFAGSPTQTALTGQGVIVGTLQYMAPEQLEGKRPDARTDVWALGALLYEMLTGKRPFEGTSTVSAMTAIMEREPAPIPSLQPLTPPALDRLVRKCLAKDAEARWQSAGDLADELRWVQDASKSSPERVGPAAGRPRVRGALSTIRVLAAVGAGAGLMWLLRPPPPSPPVAHVSLDVSPAESLNAGAESKVVQYTPGGTTTALDWTPDGRAVVFVGRRGNAQQLYVRPLDAAEAQPLKATEGAQVPAVSRDGRSVAFWAAGTIKNVPITGGPVAEIASGVEAAPWGMTWDGSGRLYVATADTNTISVIAPGRPPAPVTKLGDAERSHRHPSLLPGDRVLLFTSVKRTFTWGDEEVIAQTLATGERRVLLSGAAEARYVPSGHLVYLRLGKLCAVPFDPQRVELRGHEVQLLGGVAQALTGGSTADISGSGQYAVAPTGVLAWISNPVVGMDEGALVQIDRHGTITPLPTPVRSYTPRVRLSPDRRRLAVTIHTLREVALWVYDLAGQTWTQVNGDGEALYPTWMPDGRRLVFLWQAGGRDFLATQPADALGIPSPLLAGRFVPASWLPDGRTLLGLRGGDVQVVTTADGKASVRPLRQTPQIEEYPEVSPDGHWLVYLSHESGQPEIYVRPFPGPGDAQRVASGHSPAWHRNGREIFFVQGDADGARRQMMAAEFSAGPPVRCAAARPLFDFNAGELALACTHTRCYDVSVDGQHFYGVRTTASAPPVVTHVNLIFNWFEELKTKVPPAR